MRIVQKVLQPSRDDAVRLTRIEKMAMLQLAYVATVLEELQNDLGDRLEKIDQGAEKMHVRASGSDEILNDLRLTVPMNQRMSLQNTAMDYEMRLTPKLTPMSTNVIMDKDEFKEIVDIARTKCHDCTEDSNTCTKCRLFKLLTSILPLEDYDGGLLCPYNLGEWAN